MPRSSQIARTRFFFFFFFHHKEGTKPFLRELRTIGFERAILRIRSFRGESRRRVNVPRTVKVLATAREKERDWKPGVTNCSIRVNMAVGIKRGLFVTRVLLPYYFHSVVPVSVGRDPTDPPADRINRTSYRGAPFRQPTGSLSPSIEKLPRETRESSWNTGQRIVIVVGQRFDTPRFPPAIKTFRESRVKDRLVNGS